MKLRITNNRQGPYGVEKVGGGYEFIQPGKTRTVDAANPSALYGKDFLVVEATDSEVAPPPASLKAKAKRDPLDHDGKEGRGGSVKGYHSTAAKGARRRRKAAKK